MLLQMTGFPCFLWVNNNPLHICAIFSLFIVCPKTSGLPDISPTKMGLLGVTRGLHFEVYNHGEPHASPCTARRREHFHRGENEVGRAIVNQKSMAFHWLNPCQERRGILLPVGLCCCYRA